MLRDLSALMPPRDDTETERTRLADQLGWLQARAELALEEHDLEKHAAEATP